MRYVKVDKLREGMISVRPLFSGRALLLAANKKLSFRTIDLLKENRFHGIYIYDEYKDYDSFEELIDLDLHKAITESLDAVDVDNLLYASSSLVDRLAQRPELLIDLNELFHYDCSTYEHSINVAITSTACGMQIGVPKEQLLELSTAAMLHDIGKIAIPHNILNKDGKLTDEERKIIERHPQYGYDILYNNYHITPRIRAAVRCHHENIDGTGYPLKLKGKSIPLFARIIHMADVYDALCKKRAYKDKFLHSESIEYLLGGSGTMFDIDLVREFLKVIVAYPVGCDIELSNGSVAHVVKNYVDFPLRPKVVVGGNVLDLAHDKSTYNLTVVHEVSDL